MSDEGDIGRCRYPGGLFQSALAVLHVFGGMLTVDGDIQSYQFGAVLVIQGDGGVHECLKGVGAGKHHHQAGIGRRGTGHLVHVQFIGRILGYDVAQYA